MEPVRSSARPTQPLSVDTQFRLARGRDDGTIAALRPQPGTSDVLIVDRLSDSFGTIIEVYDRGAMRPESLAQTGTLGAGTSVAFADSPTVVYTRWTQKLVSATVTENGLEGARVVGTAFLSSGYGCCMVYGNGRFYGDQGEIVSTDGVRTATLTGVGESSVLPGEDASPVFYLWGTFPRKLTAFDTVTLDRLWIRTLPMGTGYEDTTSAFVRAGSGLLAFLADDAVHIVDLAPRRPAILTITTSGTGTGMVTVPLAIDCGTICAAQFKEGEVVALTAVAASGSKFTGWTGDVDCADGSVTMPVALMCNAVFTRLPTFTDEPLQPGVTPVRAVHINELRSRIDELRGRWGLNAFGWLEPTLAAGLTPVKAAHLVELRAAIADVCRAAGVPVPTYATAAIVPGVTVIRSVDIAELRAAVVALW